MAWNSFKIDWTIVKLIQAFHQYRVTLFKLISLDDFVILNGPLSIHVVNYWFWRRHKLLFQYIVVLKFTLLNRQVRNHFFVHLWQSISLMLRECFFFLLDNWQFDHWCKYFLHFQLFFRLVFRCLIYNWLLKIWLRVDWFVCYNAVKLIFRANNLGVGSLVVLEIPP